MTARSDLPQGTLDLLVLKVLALGPLHGYAVAQRLQQISRDVVQVTQGTLYPALHRLENRGLLAAEWKIRYRPRGEVLPPHAQGAGRNGRASSATGSGLPKPSS